MTVTQEPLLRITGIVQNVDNVIHVKAERIEALQADSVPRAACRMIFTEGTKQQSS